MVAASEPEVGPVSEKQGTSSALGEARQVVVLLLGRAVLLDQLARAQRVRHHDDGARRRASARRSCRGSATAPAAEKPRPPCSLEMSMPRKPCFLTKSQISSGISRSLWRICQSLIMRHSSSVGPSRKACSSARQHDGRDGAQLVPVGRAGEQLGIEADGAGVQRLLLGVGDLGQDALDLVEERPIERAPPDGGTDRPGEDDHRQPGQQAQQATSTPARHAACPTARRRRRGRQASGPGPERRAPHGEHEGAGNAKGNEDKSRHGCRSSDGAARRRAASQGIQGA